jgi:hypothetical protein
MQPVLISLSDIEEFLTPERIRIPRIIQGGMSLGVMGFLALVAIVLNAGSSADNLSHSTGNDWLLILTYFNIIVTFICWSLAVLVRTRPFVYLMLSKSRNEPSFDQAGNLITNPAAKVNSVYLIRLIAHLALLEAAAFSGLAVCLTGMMDDRAAAQSEFLLNALPAIIMLGYTVITFATKDRVRAQFQEIEQVL